MNKTNIIRNEHSNIEVNNGSEKGSTVTAVPYIAYESAMARNERHIKRLIISLIISIATLFAANIAWLLYLSQFKFESTEISSEGGGNANYIGEDGDIYNGTDKG